MADGCDLVRVGMASYSELGRRNIVRKAQIGEGTYTGTNTVIKNASIGRYCSIAWNVSVGGGNHNVDSVSTYTPYWWKRTFGVDLPDDRESAYCEVGSDVWMGVGVNITTGVTIGHGAVLGAGSVVVKDVPAYAVMGGVPARVIRYRFDEEIRERLLWLGWWDWPREIIAKVAPLLHRRLDDAVLVKLESIFREL
ncbi:CatB-related O-acetyltransferase [Adlercreutzia sp. ZJ473]|uniref:CatB-related O-acetyltransferase n=1 Tax=Adlercreutzia sp. ZJ473 TaxID=2722822 RepID=UPI001554713A